MALRDLGADIACPGCGTQVHITPKQLKSEVRIAFICAGCEAELLYENTVAQDIAGMEAIIDELGETEN